MSHDRAIRLRNKILCDINDAAEKFSSALVRENSNSFAWHGEMFWVDRTRKLIIPASVAKRSTPPDNHKALDTLPSDDHESEITLDVYGGQRQLGDLGEFMRVWALLARGVEEHHSWAHEAAKILNLSVAQPFVNPPFRSLFWLAVADDMSTMGDYRDNFFDLIEPMIYAQFCYPELAPPRNRVRRAQVDFLERLSPGSTESASLEISDKEWSDRCESVLSTHQSIVDERFFVPLLARVDAIDELGARSFV